MIVWLNGTHGAGKTTTGALVQRLIPDSTVTGPDSPFRLAHLAPYAEAARTWLHAEAEVVDTTHLTPAQAALRIAEALEG
ncbi:hypothetical protein [Streptomyces sp. WAC08241]|uniref:hypothetical protein n=1 Tax=Streptomyces sp. WAC08241 TaxID=2487421 RepID=UPI000F781B72|nr:hypothetical protein [Streptomyces sp. WAC08241]RSS43942.1 hypothetical protein EF906_08405 [Streptomyces sp. WAC08241]